MTTIRMLHELAEATAVFDLFVEIWDADQGQAPVDVSMLMALAHSDCYLAGAYDDDDQLIGASVGFIGGRRRETLHSHVTGVRNGRTSAGVGYALKQHQRSWALDRGLSAITWTFDPLVARNAYFNLTRLGGGFAEYLINFYGPMSDGLNLGQPSDRGFVRWELSGQRSAGELPEAVPALTIGPDGQPLWQQELITDRPVELIIPGDIERLRRTDPARALEWRMALREAITTLLDRHWCVIGFRRDGGYLLKPPSQKEASDADR